MSARTATPAVVSVYDHENGLLDQIEALTAPPAFNGKGPTYKKTGGGRGRCQPLQRWKSVNSQYCNACREGGELLCCDRCPASFHLLCHEPPINPQHIPTGKWLCNRCCSCPEVGQPENETAEEPPLAKAASKVNGVLNGRAAKAGASSNATALPINAGDERVMSNMTETERNNAVVKAMLEKIPPGKLRSNPLSVLAEAAAAVNSSEFALPDDIRCPVELPGDDAVSWRNRAEKWRRLPHERDANGMVPRKPLKLCYMCSRCCRDALLVQCDFCPLTFHLDCLDPPLAAAPKERWMCPNHVEHALDQKLLHSLSLTERMSLWKKHARQPVDELSVKLDFLHKTHTTADDDRSVWHPPKLQRVSVPVAVKDLYRRRWRDPRLEYARDLKATTEEQNQWLAALLELQRCQVVGDVLRREEVEDREEKEMEECSSSSSSAAAAMDEPKTAPTAGRATRAASESPTTDTAAPSDGRVTTRKRRSSTNDLSTDTKRPKIQSSIAPLTATQKLIQLETKLTRTFIRGSLTDSASAEEDELIRTLALQRLQQLRAPPRPSRLPALRLDDKKLRCSAPVLAVFKPPRGQPIPIQQSVTTIGTASSCSIDLSTESNCRSIDAHHASITFDKVGRRFELLNYSRAGVEVDGVLYRPSGSPSANNKKLTTACCSCDVKSDAEDGASAAGWDGAAPLRHGSIVRIGCVSAIFASLF